MAIFDFRIEETRVILLSNRKLKCMTMVILDVYSERNDFVLRIAHAVFTCRSLYATSDRSDSWGILNLNDSYLRCFPKYMQYKQYLYHGINDL